MDANKNIDNCPAEEILKLFTGKWKPQIFRLAVDNTLRFSSLLRDIEGSNKQSIASSLKEMEQDGLLERKVIRLKPLHVEYELTEKGKELTSVFYKLESFL
ncbi:winged helix-turn-helix transcriptional regulator [Flavobacterium wongokense]|uniref:winged helix-turn-helix transcriptional regulator n=1 Tax=Flavobacterium wongokense TaxID=2910674 RepID=UPI001F2DCB3B|nr:helix-turn-helix domain-containing protein [Flavobacterium sp. WG47]MCF6133145.1 helix-turn-helix transcriptional regulator [Flavobacterium sp. WG47]